MTSNRFFFKMQRELLKRNIVLPVLSGVGFFFCLPLAITMVLQQRLSELQYGYTPDDVYNRASQVAYTLLSNKHFGVGFGMVIMATLSGILLFSYLHSRKQVDFYHSLPISRKKLFAHLYLTGIISVIPLYIIMYVISLIVAFAMGAASLITPTIVFQTIFTNIMFFLLFYSLAVLATVVTGNTIIAVGVYALFNFAFPATFLLLEALCYEWFVTYAGNNMIESLCKHTFPLYLYFESNFINTGLDKIAPSAALSIGILVVTALIIALSVLLFTKRKSERAGSALAFYGVKAPLKCYLALMVGYGAMFIFGLMAGSFWKFPGIFLGVLLTHIIIEMLYHMDIRAAFANWKTMLALLVVSIAFFAGMKADIIGYDSKIPAEEDIASVSITNSYFNTNYGVYVDVSTFAPLEEASNIALVREMAQYGVDNLKTNRNALISNSVSIDEDLSNYTIEYKLKNGSEMKRRYYVTSSDEILDLANTLRFDKEYRTVEEDSAYDLNLDIIRNATMNIFDNSNDGSISTSLSSVEQIKEILTALREESLTLTMEQAKTLIPVFSIDVDAQYYWQETGNSSTGWVDYSGWITAVPVYESYTKTIELIEKYTGIVPNPLSLEDVAEIQLSVYPGDSQGPMTDEEFALYKQITADMDTVRATTVNEPEELEKLLKDAILMEVAQSCDPLMNVMNPYAIEIRVILKNGSSTPLLYKNNDVPLMDIFAQFAS